MTFPHDSVERAISLDTLMAPAMADALRDLCRALGFGFQYVPKIITFADGPIYDVVPIRRKHLILFVDETDGDITTLLPSSTDPDVTKRPVLGDVVTITDLSGTTNTGHSITIDGNGNTINGAVSIAFLALPGQQQYKSVTLMFTSPSTGGAPSLLGWRIIWDYQPGGGAPPGPG